jgi:hypothetical protein
MRTYNGETYLTPLREGGSLPAIVDTDRPGLFAVKFRGAGQGVRALASEALAAGIALPLGLPLPEPAFVLLPHDFGLNEPDPEIQDILRASEGVNFGLEFLSGALAYEPAVERDVDPCLAADIVWFDSYVTNADRTARNPNLLIWDGRLWLIDHGAAVYVHYRWEGWRDRIQSRFPQIKDHVLLQQAGDLREADERLRPSLSESVFEQVVGRLPEDWLLEDPEFDDVAAQRAAYIEYFVERLNGAQSWLDEAIEAQQRGPQSYVPRITRRVV